MKRTNQQFIRCVALGAWIAGGLGVMGQASAQAAYPSPDAAAEALASSIATGDNDKLRHVLGADFHRYVPAGSVSRDDIYAFLAAWSKHHEIVMTGPASAAFVVGQHDWSFPAPLVKNQRGWHFDVREGAREMQRRRIDRNEIAAMQTLRELCEAQRRFQALAGQGQPAQRIVSREGQYDGLYWEEGSRQAPGPSPLSDDALVMGVDVPVEAALHGYRYTIVAPTDGKSCAFAAWPAAYGKTGHFSFMIGADGRMVERDYGRQSASADFDRPNQPMSREWTEVLP